MSDAAIRIHLGWVIAVLLLIISGLLWQLPNGDSLSGYISFAASIASLILAVVAIFYSMISNNSLTASVHQLQGLASSINDQSVLLEESAQEFRENIESLLSEVSSINPRIDGISKTISEKLNAFADFDKSARNPEDQTRRFLPERSTIGVIVTLHIIAMSYKTGKKISPDKIFTNNRLSAYIEGVLAFILASKYKNLTLAKDGKDFIVNDVGELDAEAAIKKGESQGKEGMSKIKSQIDKYFKTEEESSLDEE